MNQTFKQYCEAVLDDIIKIGAKISDENGYLDKLWWEYLPDHQKKLYKNHCILGDIGVYWNRNKIPITDQQLKVFKRIYKRFKNYTNAKYDELPYFDISEKENDALIIYVPNVEPPIDPYWWGLYVPVFAESKNKFAKLLIHPKGKIEYICDAWINTNLNLNEMEEKGKKELGYEEMFEEIPSWYEDD